MAFADWENFATGAGTPVFSPETTQQIEGSQSLVIGQTGGAVDMHALHTVASGLTQGVTAGRLRTLVDKKTLSSTSTGTGIICMQSARDVTTSGSCYLLRFNTGATFSLVKITSGLTSSGTTLASGSFSPNPPNDEVFAIELMWFNDVAFGGTRLEVRADTSGSVTDFSGLPALPDLQFDDTSSPLTTSLAEGVFWQDLGSGSASEIVFDQTTLYTVAII